MKRYAVLTLGLLVSLSLNVANAQSSEGNDNISEAFGPPPQEGKRLITYEAFSAYYNTYKDAKGHKAFAQSEGGAWSYVTERNSREEANNEVLAACQGYNELFSDTFPCTLVNVDNEWTHQSNRAQEIIQTLPSFSPEQPLDFDAFEESYRDDVNNERYADALAKRVWYHHNALTIQPSLAGVRLSFALGDWAKLGQKYPPAKTLLRYAANNAREKILATPEDAFRHVIDFTALNEELKRPDQSVSLFIWLDTYYPEQADLYFGMFDQALIELQEYALYSKYLSPNFEYSQIAMQYNSSKKSIERRTPKSLGQDQATSHYSDNKFIYDVTRLVALLVLSDRNQEASLVVKKAKLELDTPVFDQSLETAFEGQLPKPLYDKSSTGKFTRFKRVKLNKQR